MKRSVTETYKLLRVIESLKEEGDSGSNELFIEGKKYFPKLKEINGRYYLNYPKNKGSFSENGFKNHLTAYKIEKVLERLTAENIYYSRSSQSVYFTLNGKDYRISDHKKKSFDGIDITINWNTPIDELVLPEVLYRESDDDLDLNDTPTFKSRPRELEDYLKNRDFVEYMSWHHFGYRPYTPEMDYYTRQYIRTLTVDELDHWWSFYVEAEGLDENKSIYYT